MCIGVSIVVGVVATFLLSLPVGNFFDNIMNKKTLHNQYRPSIEIEMQNTHFDVGQRLEFDILTNGICASPNVTITRGDVDGEAVIIYQHLSSPISCPRPERIDEPQIRWHADQLVQRISDDNFGGNGDSVITINGAFILKKAGNYTITARLPDGDSERTKEFTAT